MTTVLAEMRAVQFDGFEPGSEMNAFGKMREWLKMQKIGNKDYRIFGYNIDEHGNLSFDPLHAGYRVLLVTDDLQVDTGSQKIEIIRPGKFLVVRTGGKLTDVEKWLPEGWMQVNKTVAEQNIKVKDPARWYEEHIRSSGPELVTVDLYLEIC